MQHWAGGNRETLAWDISTVISRRMRWSSTHFLPEDTVAVLLGWPKFQSIDGDLDAEQAIREMEECIHISLPNSFWHSAVALTFGELVDLLLVAGAASNCLKNERHD